MIIKTLIFPEAKDRTDADASDSTYLRYSETTDDAIAFVGAMERKMDAERILAQQDAFPF